MPDYAKALGQLVVNFQSLEFALRTYLYKNTDGQHTPLPDGQNLHTLNVGDQVPVNALTDYSTLGQLIERYNTRVASVDPALCVDPGVITVRDALAHGRISSVDPDKEPQLLKFAKPSGNPATSNVSYCQTLTADWFGTQTQFVGAELLKVAKAQSAKIEPVRKKS